MPLVDGVETHVFTVPTDLPGGDGTAAWDSTTMVAVEVVATDGARGLGYTYGSPAAADVVCRHLTPVVLGSDPDHVGATWRRMIDTVRNEGLPGVAATAISAVDIAVWDLKARQHEQPLWLHLGAHRRAVPIYGSGGLTAMTCEQLTAQLSAWVTAGIPRVKMKIGRDWGTDAHGDLERVAAVRAAIGDAELFMDANGCYTAKEALRVARSMRARGDLVRGAGVVRPSRRAVRDPQSDAARHRGRGIRLPPGTSTACSGKRRSTCCRRISSAASA